MATVKIDAAALEALKLQAAASASKVEAPVVASNSQPRSAKVTVSLRRVTFASGKSGWSYCGPVVAEDGTYIRASFNGFDMK